MAKKGKPSKELQDLLSRAKNSRAGPRCKTCVRHDDKLKGLIREWGLMKTGKHPSGEITAVDLKTFWRIIKEEYGYSVGYLAMARHLFQCEGIDIGYGHE